MIEFEFVDYLRQINILSVLIRLFLACIMGGVIGYERGRMNNPAAFRTHMLVCVGAAMTMLTGQYIGEITGVTDVARIGAQVISGIGFLCAGTIIVTKHNQVQGLSTAAGIWAVATIGIAVGIGFYEGALIGFLFVVIIVAVLQKMDRMIYQKAKVINLYVELESVKFITSLLQYFKDNNITVVQIDVSAKNTFYENSTGISIVLNLHKNKEHNILISELKMVEGVCFIEEFMHTK